MRWTDGASPDSSSRSSAVKEAPWEDSAPRQRCRNLPRSRVMNNRRIFLKNLTHMAVASAAAVTAGIPIAAHAELPKLDVNDPQAKALGYVEDSAKADQAKFPKHAASQKCNNCQLYQGKPS